jgi:hypothetical protein
MPVRDHKPKKLGTLTILMLGLSMLVATWVSAIWVSEALLKATVMTGGLFWALTTSFTSRWRDLSFWMIVALLFTIHVVAIGAIMDRIASMNLYSFLIIGFTEIAIMFPILLIFGQSRKDT